jgi:hypothetical protein
MNDQFKEQVDDFLAKTNSRITVLKYNTMPHTVIMMRDNKAMDIANVRAYTNKEPTTYDLFGKLLAYAKYLNLEWLFNDAEIKEILSLRERIIKEKEKKNDK